MATRSRGGAKNGEQGAGAEGSTTAPEIPKDAIPKGAQPVVIVQDSASIARAQTQKEMLELRKNPIDKAKMPGGYYLDALTGTAHDSDGNEVELLEGHDQILEDYRAARGIPEPKKGVDRNTDPNEVDNDSGTEPNPKQMRKMNVAQLRQLATERGLRVNEQGADVKDQYLKALGAAEEK